MAINKSKIKELLEAHEFGDLFNLIGWDWPETDSVYPVTIGENQFELKPIAHKRGFVALHCSTIPESATRAKIETKISRDIREHLIIYTDAETKKQRWQWVRRTPGQPLSRKEHEYLPQQPMLLIEKIGYLEVGLDEEDNIDLFDVFDKVKSAFDIDKVTKKFYTHFSKEQAAFHDFIEGISDCGNQSWYASVMLNRLMFIYFIQKKGFLDGDRDYLRNRLAKVQELKGSGKFHTFYRYFMMTLCHEVLAKKERSLDKDLAALIGNVPYLNGGIFEEHELEREYPEIDIPDEAFEKIFDFFDQYEWHLDNRPTANANEINPDVLGYIFEKYINQKQMGAYYTKEDITEYISKNTIIPCLFDKAQKSCKIAFEGETSVWQLLKEDPDRYIYPSVRHGVTYDVHNDKELENPFGYPPEIEVGLDTSKPDLLDRRKKWNSRTPPEAGLPTEIWRETVARRQRYEEIRSKLENGEVESINDLITYNLDIRQFAQDVIERCESPDLLNAFWVAIAGRMPQNSGEEIKPGITVLDPTCGSGAFLFAAFNILEPLYEACLERMKGFLEEWGDHPKHKNYASFFKSIISEIDKHPSPKYFIYKSIIIHNLYGVDIMKEAVEICKLRLFLKLVAQVEDGDRIEPLPDIDFNIRAGNTLVGFATEEEMKRAMQGDLLAYATVLPEILEQAEECDRLFNLFREAQLEGDGSLGKAKAKLTGKLDELNGQLNQYLATDYGVDPVKPKQYSAFLKSHQPFHWFIEFYGIIKTGGFDAIIGNPPYVEYSKKLQKEYTVRNYKTIECGNLHTLVVERSTALASLASLIGFIVPLPSINTSRMLSLQKLIKPSIGIKGRPCWIAAFDERPSNLFSGVDQRLVIEIMGSDCSTPTLASTGINRWQSKHRDNLFPSLCFQDQSAFLRKQTDSVLKVRNDVLESSIANLFYSNEPISKYKSLKAADQSVSYRTAGGRYWKVILDRDFESESLSNKRVFLHGITGAQCAALLSSSTFWWYYSLHFDMYNLKDYMIFGFRFSNPSSEVSQSLAKLGADLQCSLQQNAEEQTIRSKTRGEVTSKLYIVNRSKPIIDEIDKVLAKHYGFTEEELDYIINYDIKYRMGKDLLEKN